MAANTPQHIIQRLDSVADAAVIAALFTILAFQEIRFEGYEAEKAGLLIMLFGILAATMLCRGLLQPSLLRSIPWRNPVILGVLLLTIITLISTLTALSPQVSLLGSADRSQGAVMQLGYILLFIQGILSAERLMKLLFPVLMVLAVPLCIFAWIVQFGFEVPRPGSTTGNPNFLASWLVISLLVVGWELLSSLNFFSIQGDPPPAPPIHGGKSKAPPFVRVGGGVKKLFFAYTVFILLLMLITLALTASRGAVLGLVAAVFIWGGLWAAVGRKRRLLLIVTLLAALGIGAYVAVGQYFANTRPVEEVPRFFRFFEDFRVESWTGAHFLLFEYHQPMIDSTGTPDALSALRPFIGHGLDHVAFMQGIVDTVYQRVTYLNSFHNFSIDTLVMNGGIGLIAWLLIYGGAAYGVLRRLNLLPNHYRWLCLLIHGLAVPFTVWMVGNILWYVNVNYLLFMSAGLGLVVGLWLWLLVVTWIRQDMQPPLNPPLQGENQTHSPYVLKRSMGGETYLMILLCVMVARWVDVQFGFVQVATEPLWWLLLGLLVAFTRQENLEGSADETALSPREVRSEVWLTAALFAGLCLIHSLGNAITSRFIGYSLGTEYLLPLLAATLAAGIIGAYTVEARFAQKLLPGIGLIITLWVITLVVKEGLIASASTALDNLVVQQEVPPESLLAPFQLLALKGILLIWGGWLAWVLVLWQPSEAPKRRSRRNVSAAMPLWIFGVVGVCGVIGSGTYLTEYTAATLHAAGRGFAAVDSAKTYTVGLAAFTASGYSQVNRGQLYVEEAELNMKLVRITNQPIAPDTAAEPGLMKLFAVQPYYHYTRPWSLFCENYPVSRCAVLRDYLPENEN